MTDIVPLLTAFGLGSIVTALIQSILARRAARDERSFREKQAAYVGLLEAYHRAAAEGTDETSKLFAYWQMRCDLVGSTDVRDTIRRIVETNDDRAGREKADMDMKAAMRADLGVAS